MRPGREHMVWTLDDVVVEGGRFYSVETLALSLHSQSGIKEHFRGGLNTNAEHLISETLLGRALRYYLHMIELIKDDKTVKGPQHNMLFDLFCLS